jgi:hypothetical protein
MVATSAAPGIYDAALVRRQALMVPVDLRRWSRTLEYLALHCLLALEVLSIAE